MNELIKSIESNGKKAISARDLYLFLGFEKSQWSRWFNRNIIKNEFAIKGEDYEGVRLNVEGNFVQDFAISVEFAKKMSMMARTEKGEQARQYFISMEKLAMEKAKPLTQIEIILQSAQMLADIERNQKALDNRITELENKPQINAPVEHFSIMGHCHNIGKQISMEQAKTYGIKCRRMCNELGLVIGKVSDPRFGSVNTYPLDVLKEVIN